MVQALTVPDLIKLLAPYASHKLNPARDEQNRLLPRTVEIDIRAVGLRKIDADLREVGPEGLTVFFYRGCETYPWDDIREVVIATLGEGERRIAEYAYSPAVALERAA